MNTKIRKPPSLRTRNLYASCRIDQGKVVVAFGERCRFEDLGSKIPTNDELEKFTKWIKRVRAFSRAWQKT